MGIEQSKRNRVLLGLSLISGAAYYRPLVLWAENAWDLANPQKVFATGSVVLLAAAILYSGLMVVRVRELPAAYLVSGLVFVIFNYHSLIWSPAIWLIAVGAIALLFHLFASDLSQTRIVPVVLALLVIAPLLQVVIQHVSQRTPYPLKELETEIAAESSGAVEDVLVIIVDSYPMLAIAREWFDHDTAPLETALTSSGFTVAPVSWSHNTYTGLAVPSILQLQQVADDSPKGTWGNRRTSHQIIGGESFVAGTLQNAGFQYIHVESGWDGGACRQVDVCLESFWLDEANWSLLAPSLFAGTLQDQFGSMIAVNTMRAVEHLTSLEVFGNGRHDFVYSHLLLPHAPYVVDSGCNVIPSAERSLGNDAPQLIRHQLSCVDSLLEEIVEKVDDTTAVLIAGDHGLGVGGQVGTAPDEWSDADVADRLGALLAYKLPTGCDEPLHPTNVYVMRAIMECALIGDFPTGPVEFLLGADEPRSLDPERLAAIAQDISEGSLTITD